MSKLLDTLRRTGFRKGVVGTSRGWFALWAGIGLARFVKARLGKEPEVVERFTLKPGEAVEIRDLQITWGDLKKAKS